MYAEKTEPLACPCCGSALLGVSNAKNFYERTVLDKAGQAKKKPLPTCPVKGLDQDIFAYVLEPCGCVVGSVRAAAITAELNSREAGNPAKPLIAGTEARLARLAMALVELYAMQEQANGAIKETVDYWIVVATDQAARLHAGAGSMAVGNPPRLLEPTVIAWAVGNMFTIPGPQPSTGELVSSLPDSAWYDPKYPKPKKSQAVESMPPLEVHKQADGGPVRIADNMPADEAAAIQAQYNRTPGPVPTKPVPAGSSPPEVAGPAPGTARPPNAEPTDRTTRRKRTIQDIDDGEEESGKNSADG